MRLPKNFRLVTAYGMFKGDERKSLKHAGHASGRALGQVCVLRDRRVFLEAGTGTDEHWSRKHELEK